MIATSTGWHRQRRLRPQTLHLVDRVKGIAFVSPNFKIQSPTATILEWPFARTWGLVVAGAERSFDPQNEGHAKYWTTIYPTTALVPMTALVRHARKADYSAVTTPALFIFSDEDAVVSAEATRAISTRWGGPVELAPRKLDEGDDPFHHVIAGDILSPGQTVETVDILENWIKGL